MMRTVWLIISLVLLLNFLAAAGFAGWLAVSDRLNADRVEKVVDTFRLTVDDEKQKVEEAGQLAEEQRQKAIEAARLEAAATGPATIAHRLAESEQANEIAMLRVERLQRETRDLQRQLDFAKQLMAKQRKEFLAEREAFEKAVAEQQKLQKDEDFQRAVRMYEQIKPDQAKQMFQQLMAQGKAEQVVNYLAAMQLRKAASVLKQFEGAEEIRQATLLVQRLRERGINHSIDTGPNEI